MRIEIFLNMVPLEFVDRLKGTETDNMLLLDPHIFEASYGTVVIFLKSSRADFLERHIKIKSYQPF